MHITFDEKMELYRDLMAPFEEAQIKETHVPYRVTLSISSVHSRYGEPFVDEMVDPIEAFFEKTCNFIKTALPSEKYENPTFHVLIALEHPFYSINRRGLGFINNNFGLFPQGIILVPDLLHNLWDTINYSDFFRDQAEHKVIVEGASFKPIVGQMQNPADFMNRVFGRHRSERNRLIRLEY